MPHPTRAAGAAFALTACLLVAACGDETGTTGSTSADSAAKSAEAAKPSAAAMSGQEFSAQSMAAMQEAGSFHITYIVDQGGNKTGTELDVVLDGDSVTSSVNTEMGGVTIKLVTDGSESYAQSEQLFQTDKWVAVTADSGNPAVVAMAQQLDQQNALDRMASIFGAVEKFTPGATSERDGITVTEYKGELPPEAMLRYVPEEMRALTREGLGEATIPLTVYVDEKNRPVESVQEFDVSGTVVKGITTYTDYGKDFGITMPSEDQVTQM
ncbi:MAG: hypothetical protein CSA58_08875 [Micrococcales bacterium]|nr:MAG: hypothetical protein CSB46_00295 [Micrococcales bacterium]PIE26553.1 MAG: hypothetical protein CSA58_08875 [Micrococcales bacterium]